jgi:aubergine-like protein
MSNYINLKVAKDKGIFQYEIKFSPDIDSRILRTKLLKQHLNKLGNVHVFDGILLYLPIQLSETVIIQFLIFLCLY